MDSFSDGDSICGGGGGGGGGFELGRSILADGGGGGCWEEEEGDTTDAGPPPAEPKGFCVVVVGVVVGVCLGFTTKESELGGATNSLMRRPLLWLDPRL